MKNAYTVEDDIARVILSHGQVAIVDASDLPVLAAFRWYATWSPRLRQFYVSTRLNLEDGKQTTLYMHRLITGAPKGKVVDHINHDTLDNRRSNLRVGTQLDNMANGKFALATHCPRGHAYDEANTLWMKHKKGRQCRACARDWTRAALARETPEQREHRRQRAAAYYQRTREKQREQARERARGTSKIGN